MAHSAVTVIKEPKGTIDPEFLKMAIDNNPSCSGAAIAMGDDEPMNVVRNPGRADMEALMSVQKEFNDKKIFFTFGSHPEGFPEDEIQPYTLLKTDTEDLVVAFVDGDFPGYVKTDSALSSAFHFTMDFLIPKCHELWIKSDGDVAQFFKDLNNPSIKKEIQSNCNPRGSVTLLTCTGEAITFQKNDLFGDYPEFWTSNSFDYDDELETRPEPEAAKGPVVVGKKPAFSLTQKPEAAKPNPDGVHNVPDKASKANKDDEKVLMRCPANITKWADVRKWYERFAGFIPGNYKERPETPVSKALLGSVAPLANIGDKVTTTEKTNLPVKPAAEKPATLPVANTEPVKVSSEFMHMIPAEEIKNFHEKFARRDDLKGVLDLFGNPIINAAKLQETETRWSTFCEQTKIPDLLHVVNWSDPALYTLIKEHPRYAFKLVKDLLRAYAIQKTVPSTIIKPEDEATTKPGAIVVPSRKRA